MARPGYVPLARPQFGAPLEEWKKYHRALTHRRTCALKRADKTIEWLEVQRALAAALQAEMDEVRSTYIQKGR
jgi:hypothetical protein